MPSWKVLVTRDCTEHCYVYVSGDDLTDAEKAEDAALDAVAGYSHHYDWTPDDGSGDSPYIADPGECATRMLECWEEDEDYPFDDWRYEVRNHDTLLGYADWVRHRREADAEG